MLSADGSRLRIYIGENDRYEKQPLKRVTDVCHFSRR